MHSNSPQFSITIKLPQLFRTLAGYHCRLVVQNKLFFPSISSYIAIYAIHTNLQNHCLGNYIASLNLCVVFAVVKSVFLVRKCCHSTTCSLMGHNLKPPLSKLNIFPSHHFSGLDRYIHQSIYRNST